MKILAINGSPNREGATAKLIDIIVEYCTDAGAQCEKVHLEDYVIDCCSHCEKCIKGGECSIDDDYVHLKAKMLDSDGIIIGSPYYNGSPVESVQQLLDRLYLSRTHNGIFDKKYMVGVSTSAVNDCRSVAEYCANLGDTDFPGGAIVSGLLYECMVTNEGVKEIDKEEVIKERARLVVGKLISDISNKNVPYIYKMQKSSLTKPLSLLLAKLIRRKETILSALSKLIENKTGKNNSKKQ